jgi:L-amino acid N-acyltransferase YncA
VGRRLHGELLQLLRGDGIHLVVAVVAQPNHTSDSPYRSLGFTEVGTPDEVRFTSGADASTRWFQRLPG